MAASAAAETLIGAAVLAVAGGFLVYAANTADLGGVGDGYALTADFRQAEGLSIGGDVQISGVKIGTIRGVGLNERNYYASVTMVIDEDIKIPEDSIAKISSEGLLGGNFIAVDPGGSDIYLANGDEFIHTQGSINLMDLVGKLIHGTAN